MLFCLTAYFNSYIHVCDQKTTDLAKDKRKLQERVTVLETDIQKHVDTNKSLRKEGLSLKSRITV